MAPWRASLLLALCACAAVAASFEFQENDPLVEASPHTFMESSPGIAPGAFISCSRIRVSGLSRLKDFRKLAHSVRVNVAPPVSYMTSRKIQVCVHQNKTMDMCQCEKESWKSLDKGTWSVLKSPFETKYIDVRTVGSITEVPVTVTLKEEFGLHRVFFFGLGIAFLIAAPIVSGWVPFYYSSAMTMGILLVVVILLFQGMKLLPTGRKSTLYLVLYGSVIGVGTVLLKFLTTLVTPILQQLGLGDDMFKPVAILCFLGITLVGAYLGYMGVRKFVLTDEGDVDSGTAKFVKWAIRLVAAVMLLESSSDPFFRLLALCVGVLISWIPSSIPERLEIPDFSWPWSSGSGRFDAWRYRKKHVNLWKMKQTGRTSPYAGASSSAYHSPVTLSGKRVFVSPPARYKLSSPDQTFYSTFHRTPERKNMSKAEFEGLARECTLNSMQALVASPKFAEWAVENADRISVLPHTARDERPEDEIEHTARMH